MIVLSTAIPFWRTPADSQCRTLMRSARLLSALQPNECREGDAWLSILDRKPNSV